MIRPGIEKRLLATRSTSRCGSDRDNVTVAQPTARPDEEWRGVHFSRRFACPDCGISFPEISPRLVLVQQLRTARARTATASARPRLRSGSASSRTPRVDFERRARAVEQPARRQVRAPGRAVSATRTASRRTTAVCGASGDGAQRDPARHGHESKATAEAAEARRFAGIFRF